MKVLLSWLRELVPIGLDTPALCDRLSAGGLVVDGVEVLGAEIRDVVVAEILSTAPHPSAERLTVCEIRTGAGPTAPVVCGARNMQAGDRVAYAPPGATLPGGRRIERVEIRGVASAGMLCSEAELGIGAAAEGILILGAEAPLGARLAAHLGIEDTVLDIDVTPNRGDCLSILGIAREIAALTGQPLPRTRSALREKGAPAIEAIGVRIEDPLGCPRYAARIIRGVSVRPSPSWVARRLEAVGLRAINNVVDVTNLVMIERGQPLHAFDYARLDRREVVVRRAGATQRLRTLDGVERSLAADDLLITTGETPIALAGVMGGADTEVSDATTTVLLESACFDPASIRRTARRSELRSEASYRFERGVDVEGVLPAIDRAAALLKQLAGGEVAPGIVESYPAPHRPSSIHLRPKRAEELLGVGVQRSEMATALKALGATIGSAPQGALMVTPPSFRRDLTREIDLVEEVARVLGYERIAAAMPVAPLAAGVLPARLRWERELKRMLIAAGFFEAVSLSFAATETNRLFPGLDIPAAASAVRIANPMNRDEPEMRRSLLPGLIAAWRVNRNQGARGLAAFSVARVYWQLDGPREAWRLAGLLVGELPRRGLGSPQTATFADAKGAVEMLLERLRVLDRVRFAATDAPPFHPGKSATLRCEGQVVGAVGALHPEIAFAIDLADPAWGFELDIEKLLPYCPQGSAFVGLPRFPATMRDVAVVVDESFPSERIVQFVRQWRPDLIEEVSLFDAYVGAPIPAGRKSLAYSIAYRAADRTLTDEEVNGLQSELRGALTRELGVALRE
ncbi:phenylalanine--tRNA ligase subunit beta [bacterium]|nr:phenylalanine--tRNA ligase subunit beta [bacterium]